MKIRIFVNWAAAICCILLLTACPKDSVPEVTMTVSSSDVTLDSNNEATIRVTSNGKWTVTPRADWLTPYPSSGTGNRDVTIRGNENTGTETRIGRISIVDETGQNEITVTVRQNPKSTPTPGNQPSINKTSMSFKAEGGEDSFDLTTNSSWTSQCDAGWITVSPSSGNGSRTISVHANANPNAESRSGIITVKTGDSTFTVIVSQDGKEGSAYYVNVSTVSLSFDNTGGSDSFTIDSNDECEVKQTNGTSSWLTVTTSDKIVNVTVKANETTTKREAQITVTGKNSGVSKEVKVVQSANSYTFNVQTEILNFNSGISSQTIKVNGNDSWTASSNKSWCKVPSSGNGNVTVTVDANNDPQERSAEITIKGDNTGNTYIVKVNQSGVGYEFSISDSSLQFEASAGSKTLSVTGNDSWTASSSDTWCTVSPTTGQGGRDVTVSVTANTSTTDRNAKVTFRGTNSGKSFEVNVKQYGTNPTLKAELSKTSFASAAGDEAKLTIISNESWTIKVTGGTWISVSDANGSGNKTVTVKTTEANTTTSQRSATITVSGSGVERTFNVTQAAASTTLTVTPSALTFEATGGKATISVSTNDQWSISSKPDWCTTDLSAASFTITVKQNSGSERSGNVVVRTSSGKEATIKINQKANSISVNPYGNDENWDNK